jgi:hypothetical protein
MKKTFTTKKLLPIFSIYLALFTLPIKPTFAISEASINTLKSAETQACVNNMAQNSSKMSPSMALKLCSKVVAELQPVAKPCYDLPDKDFNSCFAPRYAKVKNCMDEKKGAPIKRIDTCVHQDFVV